MHRVAAATRHLARFVVFGSFVSEKPVPNDVDIFMVFDDDFDASVCDHEAMLLLDYATADAYFGASVFWLRRPAASAANRPPLSSGRQNEMAADEELLK
ncbi:MAG: DUF6932 family protein [Planctomyces sp.]